MLLQEHGAGRNLSAASRYLLNQSLLESVQKGNVFKVSTCLKLGASANAKSNQGKTALMMAVQNEHIETVKMLIDENAGIHATNNVRETPLMIASKNDTTAIVKLLISKGADINAKNNNGQTAFILAVQAGKLETAKLLLAQSVDVNAGDNMNTTPLMVASQAGNTGIAELLIAHHANVNIKNNRRMTALMFASERAYNSEIIELLIAHDADVNARSYYKETALSLSSRHGKNYLVLKKAGATEFYRKSWLLGMSLGGAPGNYSEASADKSVSQSSTTAEFRFGRMMSDQLMLSLGMYGWIPDGTIDNQKRDLSFTTCTFEATAFPGKMGSPLNNVFIRGGLSITQADIYDEEGIDIEESESGFGWMIK
ncbi:ankyrin repeat domain-containing protein [bacterium]|nr:ankyrin repeat domain-containing protein [bacterium]